MKRKVTGDDSTIIHKNIIYEKWNDDNGAEFFLPSVELKEEEPIVRWRGGKIPWQSWVNICAFCEFVTETEDSECQFQLFYNDTEKTFLPWAFPQKKKSGMVTKELHEHPDFIKQLHEIRTKGYYPFGTLHTHNKAGAFQSSTDHADEKESEGLHITLGKISNINSYDIHSRFTAKKPGYENEKQELVAPEYFMLPVEWTDFIEAPDSIIADRLPSFLRKKILETVFLRPDVSSADVTLLAACGKNRIEEKIDTSKFGTFGKGPNGYQHPWRRHGNWSTPPKNWLSGDPDERSAFPDYEGRTHEAAISGSIDPMYFSSGPINDPDVNEDYFRSMCSGAPPKQQTEFWNTDLTKANELQQDLMKDDMVAFCELREMTASTLLDLLIDGSRLPENEGLLKDMQDDLEEHMEEMESTYNVKVSYADVISILEELRDEDQQQEISSTKGKTKGAITKRKKLKHTLRAKKG